MLHSTPSIVLIFRYQFICVATNLHCPTQNLSSLNQLNFVSGDVVWWTIRRFDPSSHKKKNVWLWRAMGDGVEWCGKVGGNEEWCVPVRNCAKLCGVMAKCGGQWGAVMHKTSSILSSSGHETSASLPRPLTLPPAVSQTTPFNTAFLRTTHQPRTSP